jgi:hypothetical protein
MWDSLGDALDGAGKKDEPLASYRKAGVTCRDET